MGRLDFFIFGYRKISVASEDSGRAATLLLSASINATVNYDGSIYLRERDFPRCKKAFAGRIRYTSSDCFGIPGTYSRIGCKIGLLCGIIASFFISVYLSGLVWDVRVEGNLDVPDSAVTEALENSGFFVGASWRKADLSKIEASVLSLCPEVSWINVNRRGTVAYVSVIEKEDNEKDDNSTHSMYSNIIATEDCVIEEIRVVRGTAEVKVGDVVKKGDLLISGILPDSAGGRLCYAEGVVIGRVGDSVVINTEREYEKKLALKPVINKINIKILNFSVNIFKNSRNFGSDCVIIKDIDGFSLFGAQKLPIEIVTEQVVIYKAQTAAYNDKELVEITSSRLTEKLSDLLGSSDLLRIKKSGEFTDTGYFMRADIVYLKEVSDTLEFD